MVTEPRAAPSKSPLRVSGVFSDLLYQPWFLGHLMIDSDWLQADTIQRRCNLSVEDFRRDFELPNRPVVLSGAAAKWPAVEKWCALKVHQPVQLVKASCFEEDEARDNRKWQIRG
jgi:hypothetical protein